MIVEPKRHRPRENFGPHIGPVPTALFAVVVWMSLVGAILWKV